MLSPLSHTDRGLPRRHLRPLVSISLPPPCAPPPPPAFEVLGEEQAWEDWFEIQA